MCALHISFLSRLRNASSFLATQALAPLPHRSTHKATKFSAGNGLPTNRELRKTGSLHDFLLNPTALCPENNRSHAWVWCKQTRQHLWRILLDKLSPSAKVLQRYATCLKVRSTKQSKVRLGIGVLEKRGSFEDNLRLNFVSMHVLSFVVE